MAVMMGDWVRYREGRLTWWSIIIQSHTSELKTLIIVSPISRKGESPLCSLSYTFSPSKDEFQIQKVEYQVKKLNFILKI